MLEMTLVSLDFIQEKHFLQIHWFEHILKEARQLLSHVLCKERIIRHVNLFDFLVGVDDEVGHGPFSKHHVGLNLVIVVVFWV